MFKLLRNHLKRAFSGVLACTIISSSLMQSVVSAEEPEKYKYTLFGRNGIMMTADNLCINGNVHTNKEADISKMNGNINGSITTGNDTEKRIKHVYADKKIVETYFTENCKIYESEYVYSDINIHINNPMFCYNNIILDGNVSLNSNIGSLMNINITGEVKNANNSVVYSKFGDITIENDSTANINGLIYVPLGTLTINSPNVSLNGVIIADKIVINGSSININYKNDIARFIGETSEIYDFSGLESLPEEWLGDSDEDDLFDIYEKVIDTDPYVPDTDGDELPDGYEVLTLNTDPLEVDTDENGILDSDEDFDSDNLTNLGEYKNLTDPFNPDTDEDGFFDGDEVYKYKTEPLNPDTDNDGLLDGEESYDGSIYEKYGIYFDPLNPDTNSNGILDGDEVFGQSKQQEVETFDEAITEVTVDMDINGSLDRNLIIESMYDIDAMSTNVFGLVGEPFNFTSSSSFESATITFKIDQSKLGDSKFDNLLILWYNEEEQIFEEMPTIHNATNSTVSTTTTHFSQYMVVDSEKWFTNWENSLNALKKMWIGNTTYQKDMYTIFLIDCSYWMESIDEIRYAIEIGYNGVTRDNYQSIIADMDSPGDVEYSLMKYGRRICNRTTICENIINNMGNDDRAMVMTFSNDIETHHYTWTRSWSDLISGVQKVNNDGTSSYLDKAIANALSYADDDMYKMYRIIVLTHSNVSYSYNLSSYDYTHVDLNIVNLGPGSINGNLESIVHSTGGEVYDVISANDLTYQFGDKVYTPPQYVGEDSDEDGIPDLVELYGLKPNGQPIGTSPYMKDSDKDGIDDNEELQYYGIFSVDELYMNYYCNSISYHSDPANPDTDGDGYNDKEDIDPLFYDEINGLIFQSKHKMGIGYNEGKLADDLKTNDYSDAKLMDISNQFEYQLIDNEEYVIADFVNMSDLFSWGKEADKITREMMNVFLNGTDDYREIKLTNDEGDIFYQSIPSYSSSLLTKKVGDDEQTIRYIAAIKVYLNDLLKKNYGDIIAAKRGIQDIVNFSKVNEIAFSRSNMEYLTGGMTFCINDLWGSYVTITDYKFDGVNYSGNLHFTLYDHFGLDQPDVEKIYVNLAGFRAWFVLQHHQKYNGKYQPFINLMEYDIPFGGTV